MSRKNEFGDKNNLETKFNRPSKTEKKIDDWNHQYQLENVAVYHNEQNKKGVPVKVEKMNLETKNYLETSFNRL